MPRENYVVDTLDRGQSLIFHVLMLVFANRGEEEASGKLQLMLKVFFQKNLLDWVPVSERVCSVVDYRQTHGSMP